MQWATHSHFTRTDGFSSGQECSIGISGGRGVDRAGKFCWFKGDRMNVKLSSPDHSGTTVSWCLAEEPNGYRRIGYDGRGKEGRLAYVVDRL
jgi:hypothetical protein